MIQLNLFPETNEERLIRELDALKKKYEKMRRAQFARISELQNEQEKLKHEFEVLKAAICANRHLTAELFLV